MTVALLLLPKSLSLYCYFNLEVEEVEWPH